jgi:hypothetical protein
VFYQDQSLSLWGGKGGRPIRITARRMFVYRPTILPRLPVGWRGLARGLCADPPMVVRPGSTQLMVCRVSSS